MAGIISPGMPVFVVENSAGGNRAYCNFNEGLGKVLRFGANGAEVIARLRTMARTIAPTLAAALARTGPVDLKPLMAQAINMGDEVHNRNVAATALFIKRIAPALLEADVAREAAAETLAFVAGNDHFFLNLSMAASKAMCDAAAGVAGSSMVTAMARNGVNFGGEAASGQHTGPNGAKYDFGGKVYCEARFGDQAHGDVMGSLTANDPNWAASESGLATALMMPNALRFAEDANAPGAVPRSVGKVDGSNA